MTIRKPPGKRLTSLLLSLALLLTLVPAMGTTAAAANNAPTSVAVTINGTSINLDSGDYVAANDSTEETSGATSEPSSYVAWYHDGILTLNGYDGGSITTGSLKPADTTIKLKGSNKVTVDETACQPNVTSRGIYHDGGGDLTITGDSGSTLEVDVAGGGRAHAIVTNDSLVGDSGGTLTIGGSAKVSIRAKTTASAGTAAYGIYVPGGVTIEDAASLDVTCETNCSSAIAQDASKMGAGILTSADGTKSLTINTSGAVCLDFSKANNAYSTYALDTRKVVLTQGRLEMFWKLTDSTDGFGYSDAMEQGTEAGTYAAREKRDVNSKKGAAVFVKGTPRTLKLVNALDAAWAVSSDNEVQYVAGEKVTLKPVSITKDFHTGWKSADVEISGDTFTMPDKDIVTVEGLYNVFAQQPSFEKNADNRSGTISFKLNGSPENARPALVRENSDKVVYLTDTSVTDGERKYSIYNNGGEYGVPPGQYRVKVEYGNYTFYSDVFTVKYTAPTASVTEENAVTVSGSAGTAINETVTVTLQNDTFADPLPSNGKWIQNLPDGLSQSVTRIDNTTATITITGTPLVASTAEMEILIPAGALMEEKDTSVGVFVGGKAMFAITSSYPTADKIVIGGTAFPNGNSYYKNGTGETPGGFTDTASDYNAKYDPATGTLTLNGYDGPYIRINETSSEQTVIVKLEGETSNTVKGDNVPAIQLSGGANLIVTADADANLNLTGGTNRCAIGPDGGNTQLDEAGTVTISGKANVTINASAEQYMTAYGILSGKDVTIEKNASLSVKCTKTGDTSVTAYGIKASGKVTVDTTGTVDINVSECGQRDTTYCISAGSIAFQNAKTITLKYVPFESWGKQLPPTSPKDPTPDKSDSFDASGMKLPTTDVKDGVTTVTYAKKGAPPAKPEISAAQDTKLTEPTKVRLSCTTPNVVIYYTTDGSDPKDSSSSREEYNADAPFKVFKTCTVKAVAYSAEDRLYSDVASKPFKWMEYTITVENGAAYSNVDRTNSKKIDKAAPGTTVYLKASATRSVVGGKEQVFSRWTVTTGSVTIESSNSCDQAYFTMPDGNVTVKANYIEKPAGVTVSGTAVSWNNKNNAEYYLYPADTDDTVIRAQWKTGGTVSGYSYTGTKGGITQNADGKRYDQTFSFSTVPAGTYKLVIFKPDKYVPKIVEITVGSTADYSCGEQKLWLYGDVNYDGAVKANDATQITRKVNKLGSIFDTGDSQTQKERLIAADVNCDGQIKGNDAAQIERHVNKLGSVFKNFM